MREKVPVGFKRHKEPQKNNLVMPGECGPVMSREEGKIDYQVGTLGGGNHFIEIQESDDGHIWYMIHSGSRNFGKQVCDYYNAWAAELNSTWRSKAEDYKDLAFLPIGTQEARAYIIEMKFALEFAKENREQIANRVEEAFREVIGHDFSLCGDDLDVHHNYARVENHYGQNVWVHRKGATSAKLDERGIIPGSMGTPSYIVEGLGNIESFKSCSHGAGRKMGRAEASRTLDVAECDKAMEGVTFGRWGIDRKGRIDLGEAPQAYKDIDAVIKAQLDLIDPVVKLRPLGVIKG